MILNENHIEQFERYVNGKMNDQDHSDFEELLRTNDGIRTEFYIFSDMFDDINLIADSELKNELNNIHENVNSDYLTKESRLRKVYYGLGILFFGLILFTVYFMAAHHSEFYPEERKESPTTDSIEVKVETPVEIQDTIIPIEEEVMEEQTIFTPVTELSQTFIKLKEYNPEKSYSFSDKGLNLYGFIKSDVIVNIIKDKNRFYLKVNNALYLLEKTGNEIAKLETIKPSYKSLIQNKKGITIPVEFMSNLYRESTDSVRFIFKDDYSSDQISNNSKGIYLGRSNYPVKSIKERKDKSLIISTEKGVFIFNKEVSQKLQVWNSTKAASIENVTLMDSFLENEYLEENSN